MPGSEQRLGQTIQFRDVDCFFTFAALWRSYLPRDAGQPIEKMLMPLAK
jgi:hypothetical protein